jgi:hypothetical protein
MRETALGMVAMSGASESGSYRNRGIVSELLGGNHGFLPSQPHLVICDYDIIATVRRFGFLYVLVARLGCLFG